jgi:hypothetical protein
MDNVTTKVMIGEVRFSYVHLFAPDQIDDSSEPKYSVSLIIPKSNKRLINDIKAAIDIALENGVSSKFGGKKPTGWKSPLRDGDLDRPDDNAYANSFFINASSRMKPGVVKRDKVLGKNALVQITDEEEVYSGCYGYASVNFFAFNTAGNKGVAAGLNNVLKTRDGDYLGGRVSAEADFADVAAQLNDDDEDLY